MESNSRLIEITCPNCKKSNKISVPDSILSQKSFGAIKIQIPIGAVCPDHQFIVYVDTKGNVRGYEKIDMYMSNREETEQEKKGFLSLRKLMDIFGTYGLLSLIHAKIFNYRTYIIIDNKFEYPEYILNDVADRMLPERFRGDKSIYLIKENNYNHSKFDEEDFIMDIKKHIIQTPWIEKLKFEETILKYILDIIDEDEQLYIVQQNLTKFIDEAIYVSNEILPNCDMINEKDLFKQLSTDLKLTKKDKNRLKLIKSFIKRRISPELAVKIQ